MKKSVWGIFISLAITILKIELTEKAKRRLHNFTKHLTQPYREPLEGIPNVSKSRCQTPFAEEKT